MKTNNKKPKVKTIYSLRVYLQLRKRGIMPILECESPYKKGYKCWVYELSENVQEALNEILGGMTDGNRNS